MKRIIAHIILIICCSGLSQAQESTGAIALNLPARNSLMFNKYILSPTLSFAKEDYRHFTINNKREFLQVGDAPETYLASFSGRFSEKMGAGLGVFQRNFGVFTTFGGIANFAYNAQLTYDSNLTFGLNLIAYSSRVNMDRVVSTVTDPILNDIPSSFITSISPGINYGGEFLDVGVTVNNLVAYDMSTSQLLKEQTQRGIQGHLMYTGYVNSRGLFDNSKFSVLGRAEFQEDISIYSGTVMLTVPKGFWLQGGYSTLYGGFGGAGFNITSKLALEYNYEKSLGNYIDLGSSHELTLAFIIPTQSSTSFRKKSITGLLNFEKNRRKSYSTRRRLARNKIKKESNSTKKSSPSENSNPVAEVDTPAKETKEQTTGAAEAKAQQEAEKQARLAAAEQARLEAEEQTRLAAKAKAQQEAEKQARLAAAEQARLEAEEQTRLAAEAKAQQEAEERARLAAAEQARLEAEEQTRLAAEAKAQQEAEEQVRLAAAEQARLEAEEQTRLAAEAKAQQEAEEQVRLAAAEQARLEAEEQARLAAAEQARLEAEEQTRLAAEAKAQQEAEEQARLAAAEQARLEAEEQTRLAAEAKAQQEAEEQARLAAAEQARLEAEEQTRLAAEAKAQQEAEEQANIKAPTDDLGRSLQALTAKTQDVQDSQDALLERLTTAVQGMGQDLEDLRKENDLSEQGIFVEPKPFKSVSKEKARIASLRQELNTTLETQNSKIKELEDLYSKRVKKLRSNDKTNQYYRDAIATLIAERDKSKNAKSSLIASLERIEVETQFERKRRIKRAAFNNEDDRYKQDQASLQRLKQNTPVSSTPLKEEDFDFGEPRSSNIQILKNVENIDNAYYIVLAVHKDSKKRDDFVRKVLASGYSQVKFFYDINTSKYYIYADKASSLTDANRKLESQSSAPYAAKKSIIKIEN